MYKTKNNDTINFRVGYQRSWTKDQDPGGGEVITDLSGYIPVQRRIQEMIDAGKRLVEHRTAEAYYHFKTGEEVDLDFYDPTMEKGYDITDAQMQEQAAIARLKEQEEAFKAFTREQEEAEKAALKKSEGVSE